MNSIRSLSQATQDNTRHQLNSSSRFPSHPTPLLFPIPPCLSSLFLFSSSPETWSLGAAPLPPAPSSPGEPARNNPLLHLRGDPTRRPGEATSLSIYSDGGTAPGSCRLIPPQFDSVLPSSSPVPSRSLHCLPLLARLSTLLFLDCQDRSPPPEVGGSNQPAVHAARDAPVTHAGFSAAQTLGRFHNFAG